MKKHKPKISVSLKTTMEMAKTKDSSHTSAVSMKEVIKAAVEEDIRNIEKTTASNTKDQRSTRSPVASSPAVSTAPRGARLKHHGSSTVTSNSATHGVRVSITGDVSPRASKGSEKEKESEAGSAVEPAEVSVIVVEDAADNARAVHVETTDVSVEASSAV